MKAATTTLSFPLIVVVCFLFTNARAGADTIYGGVVYANTIWKYDSNGNASVFTPYAEFNAPQGLAFDSSGNLYVANYLNNTIVEFAPNGTESVFAHSGFTSPRGIAFDSAGNLYAACDVGGIVKFNSSGIGVPLPSSARTPVDMAFDKGGNLYVADYVVGAILKYDPSGAETLFTAWPSSLLNKPFGLAFDRDGYLYVANNGNNTIDKFDSDGHGSVFANSGLNAPADLVFDSSGNLYAANTGNNTITKFNTDGVPSPYATWDGPPGIGGLNFMAVQIPEPATWVLLGLGAVTLFAGLPSRRRSS